HYTAEYLKCYWVLLPALLLLPLLALWPRRRSPSAAGAWNGRRPAVVAGMFVLSYLLFVVWVGGDFMFARFLLPVAPLSLLAFDLLAARLPALSATLLAVAAGAATFWRHEPDYLANYQNPHGFSDNRAISLALAPGYTVPWTEACRASGHYLGQLCAGLPVHVGIAGSHANLAWRGLFPVAIECASGLTDAFIAHLPVAGRSTVGHERNYTLYPGYLQRRGVQIMFELSWHTGGPVDPLRTVVFPSQPVPTEARLVTYDRALMRELKRRDPGVMYYDFEQILDRYLVELPHKDKAEVSNDFAAFKDYYFDHNDDPQRRAVFEQFLQGR
ncbi:MAG TPA: hypothetical protein VK348_12330, partial [Planctomycetota bacterium]|nr:hypothetical protein [Planctomycetota bacterium]